MTSTPESPVSGEGARGDGRPSPRGEGAWAVVVSVGDELLSGRTVDTNAAWLGRVLGEAGVPVARRLTVGDGADEIISAVRTALAGAELVVVTGGLGPTHDDRTLEAVAALLDLPLEVDPGLLEALIRRFRARGFEEVPASNTRQARVPRGGHVLPNPRGTAPGMLLEAQGRWIVLLPGVPREMQGLVEGEVLPRLSGLLPGRLRPVHVRTVTTTGIAESALADRLRPVLEGGGLGGVDLAFLPRVTGVELRLSAREGADGGAGAEARLDRAREALIRVVDPWSYEGPDLVDDVAEALLAQGLRLATAESCTGGLVGKRLTDRPGSSAWYVGGVVAYHNDLKRALLDVPLPVLEEHGAVSEVVARAMASGAARRLAAEAAVAVTGVAGPGGGSPDKPVGTVWIAARVGEREVAELARLPGDRHDVRERSAQAALFLLLRTLRETGP